MCDNSHFFSGHRHGNCVPVLFLDPRRLEVDALWRLTWANAMSGLGSLECARYGTLFEL
jgi:hypothetical protein